MFWSKPKHQVRWKTLKMTADIKGCLLHASICRMMSCLWEQGMEKLGPTGYPASTESSSLWLNVFPQSMCAAQRQFVVPKGQVKLGCVWWCWWKWGNCDGRTLSAGTKQWNKTLPWWRAARATCLTWNVPEVFNYSCLKRDLFPLSSLGFSPVWCCHLSLKLLSLKGCCFPLHPHVSPVNSHNNFTSPRSGSQNLWWLKYRAPQIVSWGALIIHQRPPT